ncbi:MAG: ABC transporter substrate-binding protein, partial [Bacillota bacterium]
MKNKDTAFRLSFIFILALVLISTPILAYEEAPILKEMVNGGELPAVEERLPEEPLEIEPWHEVGKYGGTWRRVTTYEDIADMRLAMYGFSLLKYDDNLDVVPGLAKDWEVNEVKTEWTIYLRSGLKWSDGEPFTVDDILFWWEDMAKNSEHPQPVPEFMVNGGKAATIEKLDSYTFKVIYEKPTPIFHYHLAMWTNGGLGAYIAAPEHYLKQFHPDYTDDFDNYEEMEEKQEWWRNPECPVVTAWKVTQYES